MHKHEDINPEDGMPYCEFLVEAQRTLERKLERRSQREPRGSPLTRPTVEITERGRLARVFRYVKVETPALHSMR